MAGLGIDSYRWHGGREAMLRFGPDTGPAVIVALPLLEEANRTRAFAVSVLRGLADLGVGGLLPDLPGTGDSTIPTGDMRLGDLRAAFAAAAAVRTDAVSVAIRSGALIDADAPLAGRWHLSPQDGPALIREWRRIAPSQPDAAWTEIAGNAVSRDMIADLEGAFASSDAMTRTVRLADDPRPADARLAGQPLWRRSEPDVDVPLAKGVSADIARWIATCAG